MVTKPLTWDQRKELRKILDSEQLTVQTITGGYLPTEFIELAFKYGIEGYQGSDYKDKLNLLSEVELVEGAAKVCVEGVWNLRTEIEKKE